jgi:acyl-CoA thioesterase
MSDKPDSTAVPDDPTALARRCAETMLASDRASNSLGMTIDEVGPGRAVVSMQLDDGMMNGFAICHGGIVFSLADTAFAFACNTYNQVTVAQGCQISFLRPSRAGDRLSARAEERRRAGRTGIYDVTVTNQTGKPIAEFRGVSRTIEGSVLPGGDGGEAPSSSEGQSP